MGQYLGNVLVTAQPGDEFYSVGSAKAQRDYVGVRRAERWVGWFLPFLKPGLTVLDCGCGVGSITLDIAERVVPGQVVGIDVDENQLEIASEHATQRGLTNVLFERGDVYTLRFADASFDTVLAHTLLLHLSDPLKACTQMRRVLKADGVVGIADDDWRTITYSPEHQLMRKIVDLGIQVVKHNGGNPFYSRHLRSLLLQAGFAKTAGYAVAGEYYGSLEETRRWATFISRLLCNIKVSGLETEEGWPTPAELEEMVNYIQEWGESPDAFYAVMYCAAVGWNTTKDG